MEKTNNETVKKKNYKVYGLTAFVYITCTRDNRIQRFLWYKI